MTAPVRIFIATPDEARAERLALYERMRGRGIAMPDREVPADVAERMAEAVVGMLFGERK